MDLATRNAALGTCTTAESALLWLVCVTVPMNDQPQRPLCRETSRPQGVLRAVFGLDAPIAAPRRTAGYANDSWEGAAIGWCGREP